MEHLFHKCKEESCLICIRNLNSCETCGGVSNSLTNQCCERKLSSDEIIQIRMGELDFSNGKWVHFKKESLRGFNDLSDRYPMIPILLRGGKSLLSMDRRPSWKWKWKLLLLAQIEEATGKDAPSWLGQVNTWQLTLIDGRRYLLTDDEKEAYMNYLALHDTVMKWSYGAEKMQSASKIGG